MRKPILLGLSLAGLIGCGKGESGDPAELKIYGGTKVAANDPAAAFTVILMQDNKTVCTGVLISSELVLSAGHCYFLVNQNRPVTVGFGLKDKTAKQVPVENFAYNTEFDEDAGKLGGTDVEVNDISLIKLGGPVPEGFAPVELLAQGESLAPNEQILLAGFGKTDVSAGWFSTVVGELYQVQTELLFEAPKAKEVWLGNVPGKGACNGDSGGPALVQRAGSLKLLGVTSRGRDCKSEYIYTDLRYFQNWIADTAAAFN